MSIRINIKGFDELKRKLKRMPDEINRVTREVYREYGEKIEREAKQACPTEEMKNSVKVIFKSDKEFEFKYNETAKPYVEPIIKQNSEELYRELQSRISRVLKN